MVSMSSPIHELVAKLPEVYQPVFGYPEYSDRASRGRDQRLQEVVLLHDALVKQKGRSLRVLDLGCAQGFFSLSLAQRGASVRGIDYLEANVAVCRQLASENPSFDAVFENDKIENVIESMERGEYDLVLGLSVFHHLIYLHGASHVSGMLGRVAELGACLLTEMALSTEPLYWAEAQPEDPRSLLTGVAFVRCLGWYPTHLSDIRRPLYFASNDVWYFGGEIACFSHWRAKSHDLALDAHRGTRAYYFSNGVLAKKFLLDGDLADSNRVELDREIEVLSMDLPGPPMPRILGSGEAHGEKWELREMIPGRLLSESLDDLDVVARGKHLASILEQLSNLEARNLYHNDVRIWNVLLEPSGEVRLIDYGAIGDVAVDCQWPYSVHLAALISAHELIAGEVTVSDPLRRAALSPASLAPELHGWAEALFAKPVSDWTFAGMSAAFKLYWNKPLSGGGGYDPTQQWVRLLEQALQIQLHHAKHLHAQLDIVKYEAIRRDEHDRSIAWSEKEEVRTELTSMLGGLSGQLQELRGAQQDEQEDLARVNADLGGQRRDIDSLTDLARELRAQVELIGDQISISVQQNAVLSDQLRSEVIASQQQNVALAEQLLDEVAASQLQIQRMDGSNEQAHAELVAARQQIQLMLGQSELIRADIAASQGRINEGLANHLAPLVSLLSRSGERADSFDVELAHLREELVHGSNAKAIHVLQQEISIIKGSRSWRVTAPLRAVNRDLAAGKLRAKIILRPTVVALARAVYRLPVARGLAKSIISLSPRLSSRVVRFCQGAGLMGTPNRPVPLVRATSPEQNKGSRRSGVLLARIESRSNHPSGKGEQ